MVDKIYDWIKQGKHVLIKDKSKIVYHFYPALKKDHFAANVFGIEYGTFGSPIPFNDESMQKSIRNQATEDNVEFYEDGDSAKAELLKFGYKYAS
ncbi:hypothetical protein_gp160 [Bacillus phage vB_BceM_WH1]|nr:hypothetical protein_gp160 [Bacillus phage vB_BceM_WH1]